MREPIRHEGRIRVKDRESSKPWDDRAKCRRLARAAKNDCDIPEYHRLINLFFPTRHDTMDVVNEARAICRTCPVRLDCLAYSITNYEKVGTWGGETEIERRATRREARAAGVLGVPEKARHQRVVAWLFKRSLNDAARHG